MILASITKHMWWRCIIKWTRTVHVVHSRFLFKGTQREEGWFRLSRRVKV